jgi:hypothetical protein
MRPERRPWALASILALGSALIACNAILGLGSFEVEPNETEAGLRDGALGGVRDAPREARTVVLADGRAETTPDGTAEGPAEAAPCGTEAGRCYPCTPTTPIEFLNACTSAACIPFDNATRLTRLLPDGGLPPLPSADAGSE